MRDSRKNIVLFFFTIMVLSTGCSHNVANNNDEKMNFIYKKTQHGIINSQKEHDLIGKTKSDVSKLLGTSILKSSFEDSCQYYISSSSKHFYFQLPSVIENTIYKICFNKFSKVESVEIVKKQNKDINKKKFKKSLKNHDSISKTEIFKQIFESSDLKMK